MIHNKDPKKSINIFEEIYEKILKSGLLEKLTEIRIVICGKDDKERFKESNYHKCKIVQSQDSFDDYEFPTLLKIKEDCEAFSDDTPILYLHLKGLTSNNSSWRKEMLDVVVNKHQQCINFLNTHHAIGTKLCEPYEKNQKIPRHFSGNFWWTTAKHIKNLPNPNDAKKDFYFLVNDRPTKKNAGFTLKKERYIAEFWVGLLDMEKSGHNLKEVK